MKTLTRDETAENPAVAAASEAGDARSVGWLFAGLEPEAMLLVRRLGRRRRMTRGTEVFADAQAAHFVLVENGIVAVEREGSVVALLGPGDHYGELEVLSGEPGSQVLRAITPAVLTAYSVRDFWVLLAALPELGRRLLLDLAERLHRTDASARLA